MPLTYEDECQLILTATRENDDLTAIYELLLSYMDRIVSHLNHKIPRELAGAINSDDLLQETLRKAIQSIGSFENRGEGAFFGWLRRIADNVLVDELRRHNKIKTAGAVGSSPSETGEETSRSSLIDCLVDIRGTTAGKVMKQEMKQAVLDAMAQLPDNYRQTIQLLECDGLSYQEAAEKLGISVDALRGFRQRGIKKMRDILVRMSLYI